MVPLYIQPITFVQMGRGRTVEVDVHQTTSKMIEGLLQWIVLKLWPQRSCCRRRSEYEDSHGRCYYAFLRRFVTHRARGSISLGGSKPLDIQGPWGTHTASDMGSGCGGPISRGVPYRSYTGVTDWNDSHCTASARIECGLPSHSRSPQSQPKNWEAKKWLFRSYVKWSSKPY